MRPAIHIIEDPAEMKQVEELQTLVWGEGEAVPAHMLHAAVDNGGLLIGASLEGRLVGFVFSFPGLLKTGGPLKVKHCSHLLAVHPEYADQGIGFALKRAQWQMVRNQGVDLITWTYDPLMSRNAYLNIGLLGAICRQYAENYYGELNDLFNAGLPSDRFIVELWVNSSRVVDHMRRRPRAPLDLGHYFAAGAQIINPTRLNQAGFPEPLDPGNVSLPGMPPVDSSPGQTQMHPGEQSQEVPGGDLVPRRQPLLYLLEIPADFQAIKKQDPSLALAWRYHTRSLFQALFDRGYLVTDFVRLRGRNPRSFYLLTDGGRTLEE